MHFSCEDDGISNASGSESTSSSFSLETKIFSAADGDTFGDKEKGVEDSSECILSTQPSSRSEDDSSFNSGSTKSPELAWCSVSQSPRVFNI